MGAGYVSATSEVVVVSADRALALPPTRARRALRIKSYKTLQFKTLCSTLACNIPMGSMAASGSGLRTARLRPHMRGIPRTRPAGRGQARLRLNELFHPRTQQPITTARTRATYPAPSKEKCPNPAIDIPLARERSSLRSRGLAHVIGPSRP